MSRSFFFLALWGCGPAARSAGTGGAPSPPADDAPSAPAPDGPVLLVGARLPGAATPTDLLLDGAFIAALDPEEVGPEVDVRDLSGRWLAPAWIDSHAHVAYLPEAEELLDGGVAGVVDLAAPLPALSDPALTAGGALRVQWSGPMVTAEGGYPTQSWGRNGYGMEVTSVAEAAAAVGTLAEAGARIIKVPMDSSPGMSETQIEAVVAAAHDRGLPVAAHALDDESAARAAALGIDILAHMPVERLSAETVAAWADRAVVPTLTAFGAGETALANLTALRDAGATVLYGTDFGNTRTAAIQEGEVRAMLEAGLSPAEVLASGTTTPAAFWGFDGLGALEPGASASLLVLSDDPLVDPLTLSEPVQVWIDGAPR